MYACVRASMRACANRMRKSVDERVCVKRQTNERDKQKKEERNDETTKRKSCILESRSTAWSPAAPSVTGASNFRCIKKKRVKARKKKIQILSNPLVVFRMF